MEAELRDHLETLYGALADSGRPQEEARAEALRAMGGPEKLRKEYGAVWRRSLTGRLETLGRRFQTSRRPAGLIGVGLSLHWAAVNTFHIWWEAIDDHRTFGAELMVYLTNGPSRRYYFLTLMLCILLGLVFAYLSGERERFLPA